MSGTATLLVVLHVTANVLWIGSIVAVAVVLVSRSADSAVRGRIGVEVYRRVAMPAFIVAFLTGAARLAQDPHYYFVQTRFMHAKLFLALGVIGLHHVLGARARKMAQGHAGDDRRIVRLALLLVLAAAGAVFLVIAKPF